ncbi:MAG: Uncharacterized protein K0S07_524 [Chlamydiales bacterium]|jgi:phenylacetate-CoA ligase|nr:Uncharacterized protein [Chlamydiales bacterium]
MLEINARFVDFSTPAYGKRVGFKVDDVTANPRGELGKFGIACHGSLSRLFHQTIAAKSSLDTDNKTFYLNKKSAVKWLNSQVKDEYAVNNQTDRATLIERINQISEILDPEKIKQKPVLNQGRMSSSLGRMRAFIWQSFFHVTKSSWLLFKARFFLINPSEKTLKKASESMAISNYRQAKKTVPAYAQHVSDASIQRFSDVPITSKDNYITPAIRSQRELALYQHSRIPTGSKNDTSTGTTGKPTQWFRGPKEQHSVETLSSHAAKAIIGNVPYYFINGFALGPWASGLTAFSATRNDSNATISSPGMDIQKIYDSIKHATEIVPTGQPIVVAGYPPHLREVVALAAKEGFDLTAHHIIGVVGGEAISEGQRDLIVAQRDAEGEIIRQGFKQCYSTYGASDLDINIGYESDFEIELRKVCHTNKKLAAELFGHGGSIPMIFHYDPLNYHIEMNEESELLYTCVRGDRISPRVRYNLGDKGKVMSSSDLLATLKKHDVQLDHMPRTHLPMVFVYGRGDSLISYRGANVAPENLGEAIRQAGLFDQIAHYAFFQHEEESGELKTEILIEFQEGFEASDDLYHVLIEGLKNVNPDFKKQYETCQSEEGLPDLRLFAPGESPMAQQRERYPHAKKKYIFRAQEGDEFTPSVADLSGTLIAGALPES